MDEDHPAPNVTAKRTGKCSDCDKYGHWKGDTECDHVKSGKNKPFRRTRNERHH